MNVIFWYIGEERRKKMKAGRAEPKAEKMDTIISSRRNKRISS